MEAVAKDKIRNGHIDRALSFPLEDLYGDGQPAGQVGQEIYGSGGAFIFASRCFYECGAAPFRLFADYPAIIEQDTDETTLIVRLQGPPGGTGRLRAVKKGRRAMPRFTISLEGEDAAITARQRGSVFRDYGVPADAALRVAWSPAAKRGR